MDLSCTLQPHTRPFIAVPNIILKHFKRHVITSQPNSSHYAPLRKCHTVSRTIAAASNSNSDTLDPDFQDALNDVCNRTIKAMLANNKLAASEISKELRDLQTYLLEEDESEAASFMSILQGLLDHTVLKSSSTLQGEYLKAFNRLLNQVQGSEWKLIEEGKSETADSEPKFSTWDDVLNGRNPNQQQQSAANDANPSTTAKDTKYYDIMGLAPTSSASDIKSAFRKLALKLHPDVNSSPEAHETFVQIVEAYEVLSDDESRQLYDKYGAEGMKSYNGYNSGRGAASAAWDEFKPYKKVNKRTKARDASRSSYSSMDVDSSTNGSIDFEENDGINGATNTPSSDDSNVPQPGDVVEYPLSSIVKDDLQDGREKGVALLVGRNMDRGDASRLPENVLDLCEVEPLRQEEEGSVRWITDELSPSAYVRLGELKKVDVADFDPRWDVWTITSELSEGCGGPELGEEVIV